jgi:hypothetical protein
MPKRARGIESAESAAENNDAFRDTSRISGGGVGMVFGKLRRPQSRIQLHVGA